MKREALTILAGLVAVGLVVAACSAGVGTPSAEKGSLADESVAKLVQLVKSDKGTDRCGAIEELLRRGQPVLAEMKKAGAKPMATTTPPRIDVVYSLIAGLPDGHYTRNCFGLHVEAGTPREKVVTMGAKYGFDLAEGSRFNPDHSPACYVMLLAGKDLVGVMKDVLSHEASVTLVSLNYVER